MITMASTPLRSDPSTADFDFTPPATTTAPSGSDPGAALDAALRILAGFHRRHKNQHRLSAYWWAPFGQLRRQLVKLQGEVAAVAAVAAAKDTKTIDSVQARARFIRAQLIPKAYLAFSRLVTDRQFAPLGMLLLGVLAQVRAAVAELAGDEEEAAEAEAEAEDVVEDATKEDEDVDTDNKANTPTPSSRRRPHAAGPDARGVHDIDLGVAVAREPETAEDVEEAEDAGEAGEVGDGDDARPNPRKRSRQDGDSSSHSDDDGRKARKAAAVLAREAKKKDKDRKEKKAKKKRKRGGDEFDDLFSGLL